MLHRRPLPWLALAGALAALTLALRPAAVAETGGSHPPLANPDRSPVDLVLMPDQARALVVSQTSGTLSLVKLDAGRVVAEVPCGDRPSAVALTPDGSTALVTATFSGDLHFFGVGGDSLTPAGRLRLSFEPRGVAVSPDGKTAYVALTAAGAVAVVDVAQRRELARIDVGRWPRYLALSPDGSKLAVGVSGDGGVSVVDTAARKLLFSETFMGLNLGHMVCANDGQSVYFPWSIYRDNPITVFNIRQGWVLGSRIGKVRLDKQTRREAFTLDVEGKAVADTHGFAVSPDERWLACAAGGTHELLLLRNDDRLPFRDYGDTDHIDATLLLDDDRFHRVPLGGRPMAVRYRADGKRLYVANYLLNAVQEVDPATKAVTRTIDLGGPAESSLARKGEAIFLDAKRSLDQWYSCHSCHYEGHTNAGTMDTRNDGSDRTFKTVLSLRNTTKTGPWTWHGWQHKLEETVHKSLLDSMLGDKPKGDDLPALGAYLDTLRPPPNPYRNPDGSLSPEAERGKVVFRSTKANCVSCHSGEFGTDGKVHDVGTNERGDRYKGYNTPSLVGVFDRPRLLHDGRSRSLEKLLTGPHDPHKLQELGKLSPQELGDLVAYLKTL